MSVRAWRTLQYPFVHSRTLFRTKYGSRGTRTRETTLPGLKSIRFCGKIRNYVADFANIGENLISDCHAIRNMQNDSQATNSAEEYWLGELRSLGLSPDKTNEFNDEKELGNLAEIIKQAMLQDYGTACSENSEKYEQEAKATVSV